jgi:hypothetical protein
LLGEDKKHNDKVERSIARQEQVKEREQKHQEEQKQQLEEQETANLEFFASEDEVSRKTRKTRKTKEKDPNFELPEPKKRKANPVLEIPRDILSHKLVVESLIRNKISNYSAVDLMTTIIGVCGGNVDDFYLSENYARTKKNEGNVQIAEDIKAACHPPLAPVVHWDEKDTPEHGKKKKRITVAVSGDERVPKVNCTIRRMKNGNEIGSCQGPILNTL